MQNQSDESNEKKHAGIRLTLRALVALYLLYLTKGIVESAVKKTSPLPLWVTVLVSAVFLLASVAFVVYAWREYKRSPAVPAGEREAERPEKADDANPPDDAGLK